jgi:hypothetical protein
MEAALRAPAQVFQVEVVDWKKIQKKAAAAAIAHAGAGG